MDAENPETAHYFVRRILDRTLKSFDVCYVLHYQDNYDLANVAANYAPDYMTQAAIEDVALPYYFDLIKENCQTLALTILKEYDKLNHTDLFRTLRVYLQCERNYVATAKTLHLHRNSLVYRISRIKELIHNDLSSYESRIHILMSYELLSG